MSKRNIYIDLVKGIAIILVVFAHNIQCGSSLYLENKYFDDPIFMLINSFHMPLFMLISGYLFYGTICRHTFRENIKSRITKLIIPIFIWQTIFLLTANITNLTKGNEISSLSYQLQSYITAIWFLWSIFYNSIIVILINRYTKDNIYIYIIISILLLFLPSKFDISRIVFMYPYFVTGYLYNKFYRGYNIQDIHLKSKFICIAILTILYISLYMLYKKEDYIYTTGVSILKYIKQYNPTEILDQLKIDYFRYLIGFIGSILSLLIIKLTYKRISSKIIDNIAIIGKKSIGIYIISTLFINNLIHPSLSFRENLGYGAIIIETIIVVVLTYIITKLIEKSKIGRQYLLGGR